MTSRSNLEITIKITDVLIPWCQNNNIKRLWSHLNNIKKTKTNKRQRRLPFRHVISRNLVFEI